MKIGASTLAILNKEFEGNLGFYEDLGIEYVELLHQHPNTGENRELLESFKLKYSIHTSLFDLNIASLNETMRKASVTDIKKSMDFAREIDADIVVVHPGTIPYNGRGLENLIYEASKKSIIELGEYGREIGVTPAIENMPDIEVFIHKDLNKLNNLLESADMYMTLDIGHANTLGYAPDEMYFPSIKHIHMSDNNGSDDSHLTLGEGTIDFKACVDKFESKKYDGIYMLEVNNNESVKNSYEYIKNLY